MAFSGRFCREPASWHQEEGVEAAAGPVGVHQDTMTLENLSQDKTWAAARPLSRTLQWQHRAEVLRGESELLARIWISSLSQEIPEPSLSEIGLLEHLPEPGLSLVCAPRWISATLKGAEWGQCVPPGRSALLARQQRGREMQGSSPTSLGLDLQKCCLALPLL